MKQALKLSALGLLMVGCDHVEADHPLDPEAPAERQHRARLRGQVVLPALDADADDAVFAEANATLHDGDGDDAADATSPLDHLGNFLFDAVVAGSYVVRFEVPGHRVDPIYIDLDAAEDFDLGAVPAHAEAGLEPEPPPPDAGAPEAVEAPALTGTVALSDGASPLGVTVEAGGGRVALADEDGAFRVEVDEGDLDVTFRHPGYDPVTRSVNGLSAGEVRDLGDAITLVPLPARLDGSVTLRRFSTATRLATVTVRVLDEAGGQQGQATGASDGRFSFALTAGEYVVEVSAPGYDAARRTVSVARGETRALDPIELPHASTGPNAVRFVGRVSLADAESPAATAVQVYFPDTDLTFARALTDADGQLNLDAAPDEAYMVFVSRSGYVAVDAGPYAWDETDQRFEDAAGAPPVLTLGRP